MRKAVNSIIFMALLSAAPLTAWSYSLDVNIDTSSLAGTTATLAFDFIDGDGAVNNTVQVSNFLPGGSYSSGPNTGDVSGTLSTTVFLGDSAFFNEFLQSITLGSSLQFHIETSNAFNSGGATPDSFAFFILDEFVSLPLFTTTDPIPGSNALFAVDLTGVNDGLSVFSTTAGPRWTVQSSSVSVPTPGTLLLLVAGIWGAHLSRTRRFA